MYNTQQQQREDNTVTSTASNRQQNINTHHLVIDPAVRPAGFDLPRQPWTLLNRFRTGHGTCRDSLHRWGMALFRPVSVRTAADDDAHHRRLPADKVRRRAGGSSWGWRRCRPLASEYGDEGIREMNHVCSAPPRVRCHLHRLVPLSTTELNKFLNPTEK